MAHPQVLLNGQRINLGLHQWVTEKGLELTCKEDRSWFRLTIIKWLYT